MNERWRTRATWIAVLGGTMVLATTVAACGTTPARNANTPVTQPTTTATTAGPSTVPPSTVPVPSTSPSEKTNRPAQKKSAAPKKSTSPGRAPTASAPGRPRQALSGVGEADRNAWGAWRGQPVEVNEVWNDAKDTTHNNAVTWRSMDALWSTKLNFSNGKWNGALSIGQPMFADNETMRSCATTSEVSTWAKDLKAAWPTGTAFIRLGWEFNGDWYHWKVQPGDATAFKNCWIKWYKLVKQVSTNFKLIWNPNNQTTDSHLDVRDFWPGKAYVDAAGPDGYALSFGGTLMSPDRKGPNGEPLGINAWASWVAQKGVPLAVPEWAIRQQTWGSTDPKFIDEMRAAFVKAAKSKTGLAYESYFDGGSEYNCEFSIHATGCAGKHAAASARYRALWSKPYLPAAG